MMKFLILIVFLGTMAEANGVNFFLNRASSDVTSIPSIEKQIVAKMIIRNGLGKMNIKDLVKYQNILKHIRRKQSSKNTPKHTVRKNRMRHFRQRHLSTN